MGLKWLKFSVTNVAVVVIALFIGRCTADLPSMPVITVRDTVAPAALLDSISRMAIEVDGLKAKLHDRKPLAPERIVITDTLVTPPDTVLQLVALDRRGTLSLAPLIHRDSLWAPEIHQFDVSGCDDGFSWAAGELVCDRARFGHLSAYAALGAGTPVTGMSFSTSAALGVAWKRSDKSAWTMGLEIDAAGRAQLEVVRDLKIW